MDRLKDAAENCVQTVAGHSGITCNHGGGFLDRYAWGYTCGNCGATFVFKHLKEKL